jgi:hypothetical protein
MAHEDSSHGGSGPWWAKADLDDLTHYTASVVEEEGEGHGGGGGGGHGGGGGGGGSAGGSLYGDLWVLLRDLDSTDGDGDGEPLLDAAGQQIVVGSDGLNLFPIYFEQDVEGDYEIPEDMLPYVQEIELGRANVARAPTRVMEHALAEAMAKVDAATEITTDAAGRLVCDGVAIDSPLENLALYKMLMTAGGETSWPAVVDNWPDKFKALLGDDAKTPDWDPSSLLGAAFGKETPISLDAVLTENSILGVNTVTINGLDADIDYFDFSDAGSETYDYDRVARFGDTKIQWYEDTDGDLNDLELVTDTIMNAVFGGENWSDTYLAIDPDNVSAFIEVDANTSGANDFARAVDDARAVILFMHDHYGAVVVPGEPEEPEEPEEPVETVNELVVVAGGTGLTDVRNATPAFRVYVDDVLIGGAKVADPVSSGGFDRSDDANYDDYAFEFTGAAPGKVAIEFFNNGVRNGVDRDLYIDYIELNGVRYESEDVGDYVTASTGHDVGATEAMF